jgi:hypothetical protein
MPIFSEFQLRCEEALRELLEYGGMRLNREVVGNGETYVHGAVEGTDVEVWIYDDEAEYRSGRKRRNFEAAVFRDESERIASFIKEVQAELGF